MARPSTEEINAALVAAAERQLDFHMARSVEELPTGHWLKDDANALKLTEAKLILWGLGRSATINDTVTAADLHAIVTRLADLEERLNP